MKYTPIFVLLALLLSASSCKKNYTCKCTYKTLSVNLVTFQQEYVSGSSETSMKDTKKNAQSACDQIKNEFVDGAPAIIDVSCNLDKK